MENRLVAKDDDFLQTETDLNLRKPKLRVWRYRARSRDETFDEVVSFPGWRAVLAASALEPWVKQGYVGAILGFLRACKSHTRPLSAGFIRWYLDRARLGDAAREERAAFAWLFREVEAECQRRYGRGQSRKGV